MPSFLDIVAPVGPGSGQTIFGDILGGVKEIFRRGTTSAEERVLSGDFFPGDIGRAIGNITGDIAAGQGILDVARGATRGVQPVAQLLDFAAGGGINVAPCPTTGSSQGFPAGSCITVGDWQRLGSPKGFEVMGFSSGDTLILRKKRRRRRRGGLTKGMMTDVDYLARKLGKPAAETYLNRVL